MNLSKVKTDWSIHRDRHDINQTVMLPALLSGGKPSPAPKCCSAAPSSDGVDHRSWSKFLCTATIHDNLKHEDSSKSS